MTRPPSPGPPLDVSSASLQGRRPYNEDAALTETLADGGILLAVADGMGGHAAGEVASALAVQVLRESVGGGIALDEACRLANRRVHAKALEPGKQGMGTTLVAVLADGSSFSVANVGDSRAYLITADGIRQISADHSFVAEAIRRGQSEEEARSSPYRDVLTRSVGIDADVEVDLFGPHRLEGDMAIVLCSDGCSKAIGDARLRDLLVGSSDAQAAARAMADAAYEAGSDDNITVIVAEHGRVPRRKAETAPAGGSATLRMEPLTTPPPVAREHVADETAPRGWKLAAIVVVVLAVAALLIVR